MLTFIPIMLWRLVYEFGRNCLRDRQSASDVLASLVYFHSSTSYIKTIRRTFCLWPPLQVRIVCKQLLYRSDVLYKQRGRPNCWARSNARARLINSFVYKSMRRTWRHHWLDVGRAARGGSNGIHIVLQRSISFNDTFVSTPSRTAASPTAHQHTL